MDKVVNAMGVFDNATSITIDDKEVASIKVGEAVIYQKEEEQSEDIKLTFENATSVSLFSVTSNFSVDWGDGTNIEEYTNQNPHVDTITHTYATQGTYTATITGTITSLNKIPYADAYFIKEIIIPSTVESIESNVLDYTSISIITFESSTPVEGFYIGDNLSPDDNTIIIRVPTGSLSAYQNSGINTNNTYPISYVEY